MKSAVNIARILVGCLFIFSGLVKAIDPLGLAYKMQEFFEVWAREGFMKGTMMWLYEYALWFSLIMITLEVVLGIALLLGWRTKLVSWLLLLLMLFFTFLTSYVLFSGKIKACGCFGDCIPLTPVQTFTKDIILLILVLLILFGRKYIRPLFSNVMNGAMLLLGLFFVGGLQWYVLKFLPVKDCLPFKTGNNILELRKMPKDAVADKYDYVFMYEKNKVKKEFKVDSLPDDTWQFVSRDQILIEKGKNNVPLINDFTLATASGTDPTQSVLSTRGEYYLLFVKDISKIKKDWVKDQVVAGEIVKNGKPVFVVASQRKNAEERYRTFNIPVLTGDATAIKTAARNNVTLYLMDGPVVKNKWGGNDIEKALNK
ncbi:MAG TPA: BT_3928 family protein [Ferruginibacter sp.]|nr:BT_3928 family protein [Ferruginibacter sp.]